MFPSMALQNHSAPWILSLPPPLGTLCSVQWLAESVPLCICHALAEPPRRQLYLPPVSKYLWAWILVSVFCNVYTITMFVYMGWNTRSGSIWMVFNSVSAPHFVSVSPSVGILFPLLRRNRVFILEMQIKTILSLSILSLENNSRTIELRML